MRTTVTLEADTEALIREEAARRGISFKVVLNEAVRAALRPRSVKAEVTPLFVAPFPSVLMEANFNRLAAEWEDEDTVREMTI